ncbi:BlaI/MecI/CopY family transcriptional regulator [Streptomyces sp. LRE541]|uniref:BlaI/MecI/CopY family transcriptional regulator n=1 Tax=Streptomyces sp. LRE541 TaxID=2931983 RepID=UPI0020103350|nr:BlaI/MecI/CopY family transcriptional regulator [Streptomyces sp. LRE541]UPZ27195.1 BlaI/MecI/CopY family transcriptional regulator [Streptomyces sp. LRE541]
MSEVESAATQLKTQYAAQVSADLERNTKEQERIGAEVEALQEQLSALQHDQTLLAELQRALGGDPAAANAKGGSVPAPSVPRQATATAGGRKKATTAKSAAKPAATKATAKSASKTAVSKPAVSKTTAATKPAAAKSTASKTGVSKTGAQSGAAESGPAKPTLVELIREHLGRQSEPRSSAEVATALAEAHPEREIKPKVVRTTVEGLVAKGQVQRTKQGSSVFYTTSKATPAETSAEQDTAPETTTV